MTMTTTVDHNIPMWDHSQADHDTTEYDPIDAYWDGYQQAIDPGWAGHIGTPEYEAGHDDGMDLRFGNYVGGVDDATISHRLASV